MPVIQFPVEHGVHSHDKRPGYYVCAARSWKEAVSHHTWATKTAFSNFSRLQI